LFMDVIIG